MGDLPHFCPVFGKRSGFPFDGITDARANRFFQAVETEWSAHDVDVCVDFLMDVAVALENAQTETRQERQQMFRDLGLDFFIGNPLHFFGKTIDFKRHTGIFGSQFPDEQRQIGADLRILFQIVFCIDAEDAEIGQMTGIEHRAPRVILGEFVSLVLKIILQNVEPLEDFDLFPAQETNAALVDQKGFLDAAAAAFSMAV